MSSQLAQTKRGKEKGRHARVAVPADGARRVVIDAVRPMVDGGRFRVKAVVGEPIVVEADAFTDGHDSIACVLRWRKCGEQEWHERAMEARANDLWVGVLELPELGLWEYEVVGWVDHFQTWRRDLSIRVDVGQAVDVDLLIGASLVRQRAAVCKGRVQRTLAGWADRLEDSETTEGTRALVGLDEELQAIMRANDPREGVTSGGVVPVRAERKLAMCGAWYELFPRSASGQDGGHGRFEDVKKMLGYVAGMGFDVLYLPPIHPIGQTARKGPNNAQRAGPGDVGSPWAIGDAAGGHDAVHPLLGTQDEFVSLMGAAEAEGLEVAIDLAFQCSPDHPYVREHPEWFVHRPDGSIQYAENPPKKYQDIYPLNFECKAWESLWEELLRVTMHWVDLGVRVFRVDNPHTKPMRFWDWLIERVQAAEPGVVFLSEAFTTPKRMNRLAKGGFSQSYTYFAWRTTGAELRAYVEELSSRPVVDFFRANFWPNTPDILTPQLQLGGRPAAMSRLVLAATLSPSYGVYGPVYELCDFSSRGPGIEENLDSEKYQIRRWDLDDPWSLAGYIGLINTIRRENPALQQFRNVVFHHCDNPAHLAYSKRSWCGGNTVLCVVNTDPYKEQWGTVRLDLPAMGLAAGAGFTADDLVAGRAYEWTGADQAIGLAAGQSHIFRIVQRDPSGSE